MLPETAFLKSLQELFVKSNSFSSSLYFIPVYNLMPLPNPSCLCFLFLLFLDTSFSCLPYMYISNFMLLTPIYFFLSFFFFKASTLQVTSVQLNSLVTYSELQHRFFYSTPNSHNLSWGFAKFPVQN